MYNIKTLNSIPDIIQETLTSNQFTINDKIDNPHGIIVRSYNLLEMNFNNELLAIARAGAGVNTIPVDKCAEKGIVVFNTPGANANAVKEMTLCALLMSARNVLESIKWTSALTGPNIQQQAEKGKGSFVGMELKGKTLGVIGLGATGALVAKAALDLGMRVLGVDPHLSLSSAWKLDNRVEAVSEDELFQKSDFITIHAPLTEETNGKYKSEMFEKTKKGVVLLNFSRAAIGNADDIKKYLDNGHLKCYIVDFPTPDLLNYPGVISMPHLASGTYEAEENCAIMAAENLKDYLLNGNINHSVNYPNLSLGIKKSQHRLCALHKNNPGVINTISRVIAESNINIEQMISASKNEYGYAIIDIDKMPEEKTIEKICCSDIIKMRII